MHNIYIYMTIIIILIASSIIQCSKAMQVNGHVSAIWFHKPVLQIRPISTLLNGRCQLQQCTRIPRIELVVISHDMPIPFLIICRYPLQPIIMGKAWRLRDNNNRRHGKDSNKEQPDKDSNLELVFFILNTKDNQIIKGLGFMV